MKTACHAARYRKLLIKTLFLFVLGQALFAALVVAQSAEIHGLHFDFDHNPDGIWVRVDFSVSDYADDVRVLAWVRYLDSGEYVPNPQGDSAFQDADDDLYVAETQPVSERDEPFWLFLPYDQFPAGRHDYYLQLSIRPSGSSESIYSEQFESYDFWVERDNALANEPATIHSVAVNLDHDPEGVWIRVDFDVLDPTQNINVLAWVREAASDSYVANDHGEGHYQDANDDLYTAKVQLASERDETFWLYIPYDQFPSGRNQYYLQVSLRPEGSSESLASGVFKQEAFWIDPPDRNLVRIETFDQGGILKQEGEHRPFAATYADYNLEAKRIYAEALVTGGIGENPEAEVAIGTWVYESAGRYRLVADVNWRGFLSGAGVTGAGAKVTLVAKVYDSNSTPIHVQSIHENEIREAYITLGGLRDEGEETVIFEFEVADSEGFFVSFELSCEANSSLAALNVYCLFGRTLYSDLVQIGGYAEVERLEITKLR